MKNGFSKEERLKSRKQISLLFTNNKQLFSYPFKIIYAPNQQEDKSPVKLLISVSKRTFKHAVYCNRMKRLIRESYRLNKSSIYETLNHNDSKILLGIIFVGKEMMKYKEIEKAMIKALNKLQEQLMKN